MLQNNISIQGRSTKIKTGQAIDDGTQTRGAGVCPSPGCSVSTFGAILGPSTLLSMIKCNIDQQALTAGKAIKCHETGNTMHRNKKIAR